MGLDISSPFTRRLTTSLQLRRAESMKPMRAHSETEAVVAFYNRPLDLSETPLDLSETDNGTINDPLAELDADMDWAIPEFVPATEHMDLDVIVNDVLEDILGPDPGEGGNPATPRASSPKPPPPAPPPSPAAPRRSSGSDAGDSGIGDEANGDDQGEQNLSIGNFFTPGRQMHPAEEIRVALQPMMGDPDPPEVVASWWSSKDQLVCLLRRKP